LAARLKRPQGGELDRLRSLVADQHRRWRVVRDELAPDGADDAIVEPLPARCAKPRLTPAMLAVLIERARARLELMDTSLGARHGSSWPEGHHAVPVLRPTPGLAAYALRSVPDLPNLVLALFRRPPGELAPAVAKALAEQRAGEPFLPVFLTNHADFTALAEQRVAFEYFPFTLDDAAGAPDPDWAAYLVTTLELTMRRWGVRQVVML
jgi:hypothetical protein